MALNILLYPFNWLFYSWCILNSFLHLHIANSNTKIFVGLSRLGEIIIPKSLRVFGIYTMDRISWQKWAQSYCQNIILKKSAIIGVIDRGYSIRGIFPATNCAILLPSCELILYTSHPLAQLTISLKICSISYCVSHPDGIWNENIWSK